MKMGAILCIPQYLSVAWYKLFCDVQFECIMKASQEKIHVEDLLSAYSLDRLAQYQHCPQILAQQLRSIEAINSLAHSPFAEVVVDNRKKSLEYEKTLKACEKLAKEMPQEMDFRKSRSNNNFAYSIHSLNTQSILTQFPQRHVLTELKLKFLESEGVDESSWQQWFCPEEKVLLIKEERNKFEIKVGIVLTDENPPALTWDVYDATSNLHHHPQLFFFLKEYTHWMRTHDQDWEGKFISKLQMILKNLPCIFLFLAMREDIRRRQGEIDQETMKLTPTKGSSLKYRWTFELFQHLDSPKVEFLVNEERILRLQLQSGTYRGDIHINIFNKSIILKHAEPIQLHNRFFLYDFSMKIQNYLTILTKFGEKYQTLNTSVVIFAILEGKLWKPEGLIPKEEEYLFVNDGIYAYVTLQNGLIIKIDEDMSLSYPEFQRGFFNHFLPKLQISDLLTHIYLRNQIIKHNREFQFKIYRISYLEMQSQFVYEFRSYKYSEQQRIFKITRHEQESNDNFVLLLKVAANFKQVSFSAYKSMQSPHNEQIVADSFFPRRWREYRDKVPKDERFDWRKIGDTITYLCKCYLVERSYNKRMTEEQRKMTIYSFK